jgi:hypothetical protein
MRRQTVIFILLGLLVAACGGGEDSSGRTGITVETGADLGLGPIDRIVPGFGVGVWRADVDGDVATISERHLVGDEAGAGHRIVLDFTQDQPGVLELVETRDDAENGPTNTPSGPGTLRLQDADPAGVISGEFLPVAGTGFRFWVDAADDTYVDQPTPGEAFRLRPGGVADSFSFATQYIGVVEDSRCPPDVQCVWEGRVVVALRFIWEDGTEEFELTGLQTPQGMVFGDSPAYPATPEPFSTRELALIGLEGDVATFMWVPTD